MNHYEVLGLIPSVKQPVIRAAYRALANIYHPDKRSSEDNKKMMERINVAYDTLSNPKKKIDYDKEIESKKHRADKFSFSIDPAFDAEIFDDGWQLAIDFYPVIKQEYNVLKKISWNLANSFKLELIQSKDYSNSSKIFLNKKKDYLSCYFGNNEKILDYAEKLILIKETDAAIELNKMINIMGKSVSHKQLEQVIDSKFPKVSRRVSYFELKSFPGYAYNARIHLLRIHNGKLKPTGFFGTKTILSINNNEYTFNNYTSLDKRLVELLSTEYEDKD